MLERDRFIEDCQAALAENASHKAVQEVVARAMADPAAVARAFGEPKRAGVEKIHHAPDLTILSLTWGPGMHLLPHDHGHIWAVIGIFGGREDNIFWRRVPDHPQGLIEAAGARALCEGDAVPLGPDIIHSVSNPLSHRLTGSIHVYGGDFFADGRRQWDAERLTEEPYSVDNLIQTFEAANSRLAAA